MLITGRTLQDAAQFVDECAEHCPDLHTVTLVINGQHGGVDVKVEGFIDVNEVDDEAELDSDTYGFVPYERKFEVH